MSVKQINTLIFTTDLSNDDLNLIIDAIKFKRARLADYAKATIRKGANVEFKSARQGHFVRGFVTKVAQKYATVDTGMGMYRVPLNMLTLVDKATA